MGKIVFGIRNLAFAEVITGTNGTNTYGPLQRIQGAYQFTHTEEGESTSIPADDLATYCVSPPVLKVTGELVLRYIDELFEKIAYGMYTNTTGVVDNKGTAKKFALTFQITEFDCESGTEDPMIYTYYSATAGAREWETTSKAETIEAGEIPVALTFGTASWIVNDQGKNPEYSIVRVNTPARRTWYTTYMTAVNNGTGQVITPKTNIGGGTARTANFGDAELGDNSFKLGDIDIKGKKK